MNDLSRSARLKCSAAVPAAVVGASRPHLPRAFDRLTPGSRQPQDVWVCESLPSQPGFALHFSGGMNSGIAQSGNDCAAPITNPMQARVQCKLGTVQTLAFDPQHFSPWNERDTTCI